MSCEFAPCQAELLCATTTDAMRCLPECTIGDGTCLADELCAELPEGRVCTPVVEVPPYVVALDYDVANLHGNAVGIALDPTSEVLDVVVAAPEGGAEPVPLQLLDTGAELGDERPNIRYEVFAQEGVPDGSDDKVNVFVMRSLVVEAGARIVVGGRRPTILIVAESASIDGEIVGTEAGGVSGGARAVEAAAGSQGLGLAGGLFEAGAGGGGASHCALGGAGGGMTLDPSAPEAYGDSDGQPLQGGSSGAGTGERSGAGGIALQISANAIVVAGRIIASGYDSVEGGDSPAGGGGSGGTLLLQGRSISVTGSLRVDGGDGGLGSDPANLGGSGSTLSEPVAQAGTIDGGGGGGFGWLRLEGDDVNIQAGAVVSPALADACASEGALAPAVGPAPDPPMCASPTEPFAPERCDLCHRRFCCDAITECDANENCAICRVMDAAICSEDVEARTLATTFHSCIRQFCYDSCASIWPSFPDL